MPLTPLVVVIKMLLVDPSVLLVRYVVLSLLEGPVVTLHLGLGQKEFPPEPKTSPVPLKVLLLLVEVVPARATCISFPQPPLATPLPPFTIVLPTIISLLDSSKTQVFEREYTPTLLPPKPDRTVPAFVTVLLNGSLTTKILLFVGV